MIIIEVHVDVHVGVDVDVAVVYCKHNGRRVRDKGQEYYYENELQFSIITIKNMY